MRKITFNEYNALLAATTHFNTHGAPASLSLFLCQGCSGDWEEMSVQAWEQADIVAFEIHIAKDRANKGALLEVLKACGSRRRSFDYTGEDSGFSTFGVEFLPDNSKTRARKKASK